MRFLISVSALIVSVVAELPVHYNQQYPADYPRSDTGPYAPRGWRPAGPRFNFPERQQEYNSYTPPPGRSYSREPQPSYGPPTDEYGPPPKEYGPPQQSTTTSTERTTTESQETTTTEQPTTTEYPGDEQEPQQLKSIDNKEKLTEGVAQKGVYYIYHPTGLLQRVVFATRDDTKKMAYTTQVKYENVEPIREPIYTYDPETLVLRPVRL